MADSPNRNCIEFCRVVLGAKAACIEDEPKNLRVGLGCPARKEIQESGHKEAAEQAVQQVKDGRSHGDRDKEQLSLRAQDSEWPVEGSIDRVGALRHELPQLVQTPNSQLRKLTARTAMPEPKMIPANRRLLAPSP